MLETLSSLNLTEGLVGEKAIELPAELFHHAANIRDPAKGMSYVEKLLADTQVYALTLLRLL